jgi:hypothetical protein
MNAMKIYRLIVVFCLLTTGLVAQRKDDFHLRPRIQEPASYPVFTQDDLSQIAKQQGTLEQFNIRLNTCDTELNALKKKVDEDVLPTIHVFDFLKWLIGGIILTLVGIVANDRWRKRSAPQS